MKETEEPNTEMQDLFNNLLGEDWLLKMVKKQIEPYETMKDYIRYGDMFLKLSVKEEENNDVKIENTL